VNTAFNNAIFGEGAGITYTAGVGCSNVSCHGGKTTPAWNSTPYPNYVYDPTGANCTSNCHTVVDTDGNAGGQYINVYSGDYINIFYGGMTSAYKNLHAYHLAFGFSCGECHSITDTGPMKLQAVHFSQLFNGKRQLGSDPQAKGFASGTIGGAGTAITSYTVSPSSCMPNPAAPNGGSCHADIGGRPWFLP
jgi:hypothetical protein